MPHELTALTRWTINDVSSLGQGIPHDGACACQLEPGAPAPVGCPRRDQPRWRAVYLLRSPAVASLPHQVINPCPPLKFLTGEPHSSISAGQLTTQPQVLCRHPTVYHSQIPHGQLPPRASQAGSAIQPLLQQLLIKTESLGTYSRPLQRVSAHAKRVSAGDKGCTYRGVVEWGRLLGRSGERVVCPLSRLGHDEENKWYESSSDFLGYSRFRPDSHEPPPSTAVDMGSHARCVGSRLSL